MGFLFVGSLVFIVWAVLAFATRGDHVLKNAPLRRITDIGPAGVVKIHGRVMARGPARVAATLSGQPVLFTAFHGTTSKRGARRIARPVQRTVGVSFGVRDDSGTDAIIMNPQLVRMDSTLPIESIEWEHLDEVSGLRGRLGAVLEGQQRLQGRDVTLQEGDEVSLIARAERSGTHFVVTPALDTFGIFITKGGPAELARRFRRGERFLRGVFALAVGLIFAGIYSVLL